MFEFCGFDYHVEPRLTDEGALKSETIWSQIFDSSFSAPEARKGQCYGINVGGFVLGYAVFFKETSQEVARWKKRHIFYWTAQTRNCPAVQFAQQ